MEYYRINPVVVGNDQRIRIVDADKALDIARRRSIEQSNKECVVKEETELDKLRRENAELKSLLTKDSDAPQELSSEEKKELEELRLKVEELEKELSTRSNSDIKKVTLSSLINEEKKKTDSKSKLAIFRKIINDNKDIRQD